MSNTHLHANHTLPLEVFDYQFPESLIAQNPKPNRSDSRLLVRNADGSMFHHQFSELAEILPENTLLIINDSKVFASRLFGKLASGAKVEVFLLSQAYQAGEAVRALAIGKPMKKLKVGTPILFAGDVQGWVVETHASEQSPTFTIEFVMSWESFWPWIDQNGYVPLPPYIKRAKPLPAAKSEDQQRYQTIYSNVVGSVAAPTAGLHFDDQTMKTLKARGIETVPVTLHVGAGTFMPVKVSDVSEHRMHEERFLVPKDSLLKIQGAKKIGGNVVCVGTTSFRCMEGLLDLCKQRDTDPLALTDQWLSTGIFIFPKHINDQFSPNFCNGILTNFHQPCSTLFMLICSLLGIEGAKKVYEEAISKEYRLFSYGDTSLLWI